MNIKRVITLLGFDFFHSLLRLKGLAFLIPFALFWYITLRVLNKGGAEFLSSMEGLMLITKLTSLEVAQALLILHPPTLSVFLLTALTVTPLFVFLGANNQLASDAASGSFRYLLSRCTRLEVFFSRFLSAYFMIAMGIFFACLASTFISLDNDNHELNETIIYALQSLSFVLLYTLPYVAFMTIISALMSSALGTILMGACTYFMTLVLIIYLNSDIPSISYLLPSAFKDDLIGIASDNMTIAIPGLLATTTIYLSIAWIIFRKRNI
ncbi:MAG: hypothetical protein KAI15_04095 [Gammaproteobacteria bacterium]|nr:hypothetical protein [Gammaproteobacteria bacterium]MCK5668241.1 hypothetical protein [Gammaproteobacteria bacterium]